MPGLRGLLGLQGQKGTYSSPAAGLLVAIAVTGRGLAHEVLMGPVAAQAPVATGAAVGHRLQGDRQSTVDTWAPWHLGPPCPAFWRLVACPRSHRETFCVWGLGLRPGLGSGVDSWPLLVVSSQGDALNRALLGLLISTHLWPPTVLLGFKNKMHKYS